VEDQELHRLRRIQGLSSVNLEPPPLRRRLDQQGSFEAIMTQETMPDPTSRGEHSYPEEPTISDLGVEALGPYNPSITNFSVLLLIHLAPPRVTHHER
jgi:hypothetical protein